MSKTISTENVENVELTVQKHVVNFCKLLPIHVDKWRKLLEEADKPAQALTNYAEQLRHVEKANIEYLDKFRDLQEKIRFKVFIEMEEEISTLKKIIDHLNQTNQDLKNKLSILERSTIDLCWEANTPLLTGTAFQPPLTRILQDGLTFFQYFANALTKIKDNFKNMDVRDEKNMAKLEKSFKMEYVSKSVTSFLAIVQYVGNDKAVI
ncbi:unnamed protein product [Phaedon cochleariae]|uniref:Uncharacterized protein n=1 Tax=Phaedon cochleariae TaxID=80249 RepID=A0A9P0DG26_PHACE|nr:unnamed protein product [Phaedon cochleariae]